MISNPKVGQFVLVWYGKRTRNYMPLHGQRGVVRIASRGRPRNHVVEVAGVMYVIPAGNLQPVPTDREPPRQGDLFG